MRLTILFLLVLAQSYLYAMEALRSTHITMKEGLASNYVYRIVEDKDGWLWIGSTGGLSKFDGNNIINFKKFPNGNNGKQEFAAIVHVTTDPTKRYVWARASDYSYYCYDTQTGRFIDYCDHNKTKMGFREILFGKNGTVWMYQGDGVRRITVTYPDGNLRPKYQCRDYTKDGGQLPYQEIRKLIPTDNGGAWLCSDEGFAYIDAKGNSHILEKKRKVYQAMKLGGDRYAFFFTGNKILVGDGNGRIVKTVSIPSALGTVNRITGYVCEQAAKGKPAVAHAFTNCGTLMVDIAEGRVEKSSKMNIMEGLEGCTYNGYTVVLTRFGEVWILDKALHPVVRKKFWGSVNTWRSSFSIATHGNTIMIGLRAWGLMAFNTTTREVTEDLYPDAMTATGEDDVQGIAFDSAGNLWGATWGNGVLRVILQQDMVGKYIKLDTNSKNPVANAVEGLTAEKDWTYTVSAKNGKLFRYVPATDHIAPTIGAHGSQLAKFLEQSGKYITYTCYDDYGNRWDGLSQNGILINGRRYCYKAYCINGIENDRHGRMWYLEDKMGLKMVAAARDYGDTLIYASFLNHQANESNVLDMKKDSQGRLWVATGNGLYSVDTRLKHITHASFKNFNSTNSPILNGSIICFCIQEKEHRIWCGYQAGGLAACQFNDDWTVMTDCKRYTVEEGLASGTVNAVMCDKHGCIWTGTDNGLSLVNSATGDIKTYRFSQHSRENLFCKQMMQQIRDGQVLCGTEGGLLVITPKKYPFAKDNGPKDAGPVITDVHIDNQSVFTNFTTEEYDAMRISIINNREICLRHDQNNLTIYFSAPPYSKSSTTAYQFYLKGFDTTWRNTTSTPRADFSHLAPGTYTLHIRAMHGNRWSEESTFTIRISPPWYASWYAYIIYICLLTILCRYIYLQMKEKYRLRRRLKEEQQQQEVERQMNEYKINFFTGISHEFRTPLTIIHGVVERIKAQNQQGNLKQPVDTLKRSTERMLRLVNQLLEFRRMQQGMLKLCVRKDDIVVFVHNIFMDFHETAYAHDIAYNFSASVPQPDVPFDANHLDKIMYNLISNAFKYSERKGSIDVKMRSDGENIVISVSDTGVGVAEHLRQHLFDNYMESSRLVKDSLGIGLTLTAALVERHHGTIEYSPNTPHGSVFTVTLPADGSAYQEDEYMVESPLSAEAEKAEKVGFEQIYREVADKPINDCTILVVEDDADMAAYIVQTMTKYFKVITANNGEDALKVLEQHGDKLPEVIVTDVMMPQMDGYQLTAKLRKDPRYRSIPIIMLTALSQEDKYVKGISAGADAYLGKPFNPAMLTAHAIQLANQRINMRKAAAEQAENSDGDKQKPVVADIRDKNFMEQVDAIINKRISDESLSVETLTEEMGIGRSKLFDNMKRLCNMTPRDYILRHRMEYACRMLKEGKLSIAEIAYKSGFGHPPYFTRVFKKYYGVTPSEYIRR